MLFGLPPQGQNPGDQTYPSPDEIRQDLLVLQAHWRLLRLHDCSPHAERVLAVIRRDRLDLQVMPGAYLGVEMNNAGCPWGATYSEDQLAASVAANEAEVGCLVRLANASPGIVFSVAVGNEATADWTDHLVPLHRMIDQVRRVKAAVEQPVTFCENCVRWQHKLRDLVAELDFISLHTYPVWEYKQVHEALANSRDNFDSVAWLYPDTPVLITEAGWATQSNGRAIPPHNTSENLQATHLRELMAWTDAAGILCCVFEAFDEPWKGSPDPMEPEKHWGLYTVDRQPKQVKADWPAAPPRRPIPAPPSTTTR